MAAPIFDTSKQKINSPGLTAQEFVPLDAKPSKLGQALDLGTMAIKTGTALDKAYTLDQTEEQADELRKDYELQSASNISVLNAKKDYLETEISTADNPLPFEEELNEVTNKLVLAKKQGVMSPSEFQARASSISEELLNKNPAYADEIVSQMTRVFQRGNLNTFIKSDIAAIEAQQAREAELFKKKTDLLETVKIDWTTLDRDEIDIKYLQELKKQRDNFEFDEAVKNNVRLNEKEKVKFYNGILEDYPGSGIYGAASEKTNFLITQLELLEDSDIPAQEKSRQGLQLIKKQRDYLGWFMSNLPKDIIDEQELTDFQGIQTSLLENIETNYTTNVPTNKLKFLQEERDTINVINEISALKNGYNATDSKRLKESAEAFKLIMETPSVSVELEDGVIDQAKTNLQNALDNIVNIDGNKLSVNSPAAAKWRSLPGTYKAMSKINNLALNELKEGPLQVQTKGYFNNIFQKADSESGDVKLQELDKVLPLITTRVDTKVLNSLMSENDFSSTLLTNMDEYKQALITTLPDSLELVMNNGLFYYPNDIRLNKNLTRLNNYVLLKAKLENKKPDQISEQILNEEFPMFFIKGRIITMPSGQQGTKEELFGSEDSVDITEDEQEVLNKYK